MRAYRYQRVPEKNPGGKQWVILRKPSSCIYLPERNLVLVQIEGPYVYLNPEECLNCEGAELSAIFKGTKNPASVNFESVALLRQRNYPKSAVRIVHRDADIGAAVLHSISEFELSKKSLQSILGKLKTVKTRIYELDDAHYSVFRKFSELYESDNDAKELPIKV